MLDEVMVEYTRRVQKLKEAVKAVEKSNKRIGRRVNIMIAINVFVILVIGLIVLVNL